VTLNNVFEAADLGKCMVSIQIFENIGAVSRQSVDKNMQVCEVTNRQVQTNQAMSDRIAGHQKRSEISSIVV